MTKQEIFEKLSDLECETFYKGTEEENQILRTALEAYARVTGCNHFTAEVNE
jgi:hypothetical protein